MKWTFDGEKKIKTKQTKALGHVYSDFTSYKVMDYNVLDLIYYRRSIDTIKYFGPV